MLATRSNQRTKVTREETSCRSLEENEGPIKVLVARLLEDSINVNVHALWFSLSSKQAKSRKGRGELEL